MPSFNEDMMLGHLKSIDESLKTLVELSRTRLARAVAPSGGPGVASDRDLDGKYGDPEVKLSPRDWSGPSMKGRRMSECPAEFLDLLAEMLDYFATKSEQKDEKTTSGKPVAPYKRTDAARARGWAARIRSGKHKQEPEPEADSAQPEEVQW